MPNRTTERGIEFDPTLEAQKVGAKKEMVGAKESAAIVERHRGVRYEDAGKIDRETDAERKAELAKLPPDLRAWETGAEEILSLSKDALQEMSNRLLDYSGEAVLPETEYSAALNKLKMEFLQHKNMYQILRREEKILEGTSEQENLGAIKVVLDGLDGLDEERARILADVKQVRKDYDLKKESAGEILRKALGGKEAKEIRADLIEFIGQHSSAKELNFTAKDYFGLKRQVGLLEKEGETKYLKDLQARLNAMETKLEAKMKEVAPQYGAPELLAELRRGRVERALHAPTEAAEEMMGMGGSVKEERPLQKGSVEYVPSEYVIAEGLEPVVEATQEMAQKEIKRISRPEGSATVQVKGPRRERQQAVLLAAVEDATESQLKLAIAKGKVKRPEELGSAEAILNAALGAREVKDAQAQFGKMIDAHQKELGFNGHAFLGALKQRENAERRHDQKAIDEFESKLRLMERKIIPIMPQYGAPKLLAELRAARTARAREISVPGMVPGAARRYEADRAGTAVETPARRKAKLILSPDQMKTMRAELVKTATVELPIIKKVDQELSRQAKVDAESRAEADAENKLFADIAAELKSNPALRAEMGTIIREDEIDGEQFLFEIEHQGILAGEISELEKRISSQKAKSGVFRRLLGYGPGSVRELKNQLKEKQRDKAVADKVIDAWKEMALGTMYSGAAYRGKKSKEMTMAERMLNRASERREEAFERMRAIGAGR